MCTAHLEHPRPSHRVPRLHQRCLRRPRISRDFQQCAKLRRLSQQLPQNRQNRRGSIVAQSGCRRFRQTPPRRIHNRPAHGERQPSRLGNRPGNVRFHIHRQRPRRSIKRALFLLPRQWRRNASHLPAHRLCSDRRSRKSRKHSRRPFQIRIDNPKRSRHGTRNDHCSRLQIGREATRRSKADDAGTPPRQGFAQSPLQQIRPRRKHGLDARPACNARFERHSRDRDDGQAHIPAVTRVVPSRSRFL